MKYRSLSLKQTSDTNVLLRDMKFVNSIDVAYIDTTKSKVRILTIVLGLLQNLSLELDFAFNPWNKGTGDAGSTADIRML